MSEGDITINLSDLFPDESIGTYHEHKYVGGPPPKRLYRMQLAHETRARRLGIHWEMVDLRRVYRKTGGLCGICGHPVSVDSFDVDHIIPTSRGGSHTLKNLQPSHRACNSRKGNRYVGEATG